MLSGFYFDPLHGGCLRRIRRSGPSTYQIVGVYGDDEGPMTHRRWTAVIHEGPDALLHVDFHGKPTKKTRHMTATFVDGHRLVWSDGNTWHRLYVHADQLR